MSYTKVDPNVPEWKSTLCQHTHARTHARTRARTHTKVSAFLLPAFLAKAEMPHSSWSAREKKGLGQNNGSGDWTHHFFR